MPQPKLLCMPGPMHWPNAQHPEAHDTASQPLEPASTVLPTHVPLLHCEPPGHIEHWPPPVPQVKRDC